ncbi:DUF3108 domain-containing protein [Shewanella salipaludis]|uniref:DUF3108 domain-containing protein n=1 Tax=Shewanella salipaludis TaxID=2723052 RepID=UPI001FCF2096|nr:DUF3108 domain-containing protein [Shewanella salipaludis]
MRTIARIICGLLSLSPGLWAQATPTPLTAQTAEYNVYYGSIELGKARYQLPASDDGLYVYRFDSALSLLLLTDVRHAHSEFTREGEQLIPLRYMHERSGTGPDYNEQSAFAKGQAVVHTRYKDERGKLPYDGLLFDPLMLQLQLRLDISAGKTQLHYNMVKDNEIEEYDFRVLDKERLTLDSGSYDTVKIEVMRDNPKRQTFFWMAPELAYLPVRLTHFEKGSKQLDIQLLSYQFSEAMPLPGEQTTQRVKPDEQPGLSKSADTGALSAH